MKKILALVLVLAMVAALFVGCSDSTDKPGETGNKPADGGEKLKIAMVTDYGDITDESFNQATYEGAKAWAEENGADFIYYKPTDDSTEARVTAINKAIDEGNQVIVMPGYAFAGAIVETVEKYPDVKFIALDVSEYDLQAAKHPDQVAKNEDFPFDWKYPANLYSAVYQEELAGYMAGVAAVKLGYTKLGFLGGMAVPAVVRYGYGFVQGANDAAVELGNTADVSINYVYGNQFSGDADITAYMDTWYGNGTEVVFACGGGIYTSAKEAAAKVGAKVIGVDVDQAPTIGADMTVTSAMKGLAATVKTLLTKVKDGSFEGGKVETLGLVSEKPEENYVQLPASTQWAEGKFTEADYNALVAALFKGEIKVSADTSAMPAVQITVNDQGNIK